jgi:hypothetical protein
MGGGMPVELYCSSGNDGLSDNQNSLGYHPFEVTCHVNLSVIAGNY